jgi:tetratricopeptide (TPR) repeat protein
VTGLIDITANQTIQSVTIQIESGNRIIAKHTILAKDFNENTSNNMEHLSLCAAVWVIFMFQPKRAPIIMGTRDWVAYTWFALGNKFFQDNKHDQAKFAYQKSLSLDPTFLASRVNLAGAYSCLADESGTENNLDKQVKYMQGAIEQLEIVENKNRTSRLKANDPVFYAWLFRQVQVNVDRYYIHSDAKDSNLSQKILQDLKNLKDSNLSQKILQDLKKLVDKLDVTNQSQKNQKLSFLHLQYFIKKLTKYLESLLSSPNLNSYKHWRLPVAESMQLGLKVAFKGHINERDHIHLKSITKKLVDRMDFYSLYNLACTYALFATHDQNPVTKNEYLKQCFHLLGKSFDIINSPLPEAEKLEFNKALNRLKNDRTFDGVKENDEFIRIVTQQLRTSRTPTKFITGIWGYLDD